MATGKSAVGRALASRLGWREVDTDALIEQRAGRSIAEIFAAEGEEAFRELESEVAEEVARHAGSVIVTGGGIVLRERNMSALRLAGPVVCLTASVETILERTRGTSHRPLLRVEDPATRVRELLERRAPFYAKADHTIDTGALTVAEVCDRIVNLLGV